jgi:hypothetical protein
MMRCRNEQGVKTMTKMKKAGVWAASCACAAVWRWAAPARKTVVVWSEGTAPKHLYPADINGAIADGLRASDTLKGWEVVTASLSDPELGLPDELLARADVLVWWGQKNTAR